MECPKCGGNVTLCVIALEEWSIIEETDKTIRVKQKETYSSPGEGKLICDDCSYEVKTNKAIESVY